MSLGQTLPVPIACHLGAELTPRRRHDRRHDLVASHQRQHRVRNLRYRQQRNLGGLLAGQNRGRLAVCRPRRLHRWRELPSSGSPTRSPLRKRRGVPGPGSSRGRHPTAGSSSARCALARSWTLLREADGHYVRHDKVTVAAHLSGAPYVRMLGRYPLGEFLVGEHHPRAKTRLQAILDQG